MRKVFCPVLGWFSVSFKLLAVNNTEENEL